MTCYEFYRDQLLRYKIKGQKRPFIDDNLQLQIPGLIEDLKEEVIPYNYTTIYSHYMGHLNNHPTLIIPIDQQELEHVVAEAQQAYKAWKKMQQQITETVKRILPIEN